MADRWERFRQFPLHWPAVTPAFLLTAVRWAILAVIVAGAAWIVFGVFGGLRNAINAETAERADT